MYPMKLISVMYLTPNRGMTDEIQTVWVLSRSSPCGATVQMIGWSDRVSAVVRELPFMLSPHSLGK